MTTQRFGLGIVVALSLCLFQQTSAQTQVAAQGQTISNVVMSLQLVVVGPELSRIRLSGGGEVLTLESNGFTVTSDKAGLTITSPGVVTMTSAKSSQKTALDQMTLKMSSTGTVVDARTITIKK